MTTLSPLNSRLFVLGLSLLAFALPTSAVAAQKKNARTPPDLQGISKDDFPPTPEEIEEQKREAARAAFVKQMRTRALAEVEAAAKSVASPDSAALAAALRVESGSGSSPEIEYPAKSAIQLLGDLDGDGIPEAAFRWSRIERFKRPEPGDLGGLPDWVLFLFSWDGARWRVSELMTGSGLCGVETLDGLWTTKAIVGVEGLSSVSYPVVFRYQDHAATLAWDSRSDESLYQAYALGSVEFQERENGPPAMIVSGRADPGVIRFSPNGNRGFEAATAYFWENGAYVPKRTEFEENEDYTIYRFLAALHMRDFRAAFSLIDATEFLDKSIRTPDALRQRVEKEWPEFIGNSIFEALETPGDGAGQFAFEMKREDLHYTYTPAFGKEGSLQLTGLVRRKAE